MKTLAKYFFQGLMLFVPAVGSIYLVWVALTTLDGIYPLPIPGLGLALMMLFITLLGALSANVVGRRITKGLEAAIKRLPVVNLLYASLRDLLGAFVGDKKSFNKPVMVNIDPERGIKVFGFITCGRFDDVRLKGHVAVYLPQSYNFAGNLLIVRESLVEPVDADSAQFMAFIVSGGVAEMNAARTFFDSAAIDLKRKKR